jgi:hypothetical protein
MHTEASGRLVQAREFGTNRAMPYQDVASVLSQMLGGRNVPYGQIFHCLKQAFGELRAQPVLLPAVSVLLLLLHPCRALLDQSSGPCPALQIMWMGCFMYEHCIWLPTAHDDPQG